MRNIKTVAQMCYLDYCWSGCTLAQIPWRMDVGLFVPPPVPCYPSRIYLGVAYGKVKCERETRAMHVASGTPWETVTLTTLSRHRALFASLFAEARDSVLRGQECRPVVHIAWGTEWRPFGLPRSQSVDY